MRTEAKENKAEFFTVWTPERQRSWILKAIAALVIGGVLLFVVLGGYWEGRRTTLALVAGGLFVIAGLVFLFVALTRPGDGEKSLVLDDMGMTSLIISPTPIAWDYIESLSLHNNPMSGKSLNVRFRDSNPSENFGLSHDEAKEIREGLDKKTGGYLIPITELDATPEIVLETVIKFQKAAGERAPD